MYWFNKKTPIFERFCVQWLLVGIIRFKSRSLDVLFCVVCGVMLCNLN